MEQKTTKQWLEMLPEPYKSQAIENTRSFYPHRLNDLHTSQDNALTSAFSWLDSPQGYEYWHDVCAGSLMGAYVSGFGVANDGAVVGANDKQIGGSHYKDMAIQPSEFIARNNLGWYEGNVIKYVCRHQSKNGLQDLQKALHYIELAIQHYYDNSSR